MTAMLGISPWAARLITAKQMLPEQTHPGLGYLLHPAAGVTSPAISPEERVEMEFEPTVEHC